MLDTYNSYSIFEKHDIIPGDTWKALQKKLQIYLTLCSNVLTFIIFEICWSLFLYQFNPLNISVVLYIKTSQLICTSNQLTVFYMMAILTFDRLISLRFYSRISNRRGGRKKRGGWQILAKIINREVGRNLQS